ncbi:hypothetical protein TVAG_165640 [Trichomonas vaginalis G3]|uniref:Uncharacterized protein n=1 Tax=Trichomonas vaginalis (strain ATCC PRA-98 / G3) TaxID=412133 RepID=A2DUP5_TRIV3|nr:hypothetical protein TVAGG3_0662590 [Trichomonas vaginalis G3]EAY15936.1 hypothetical protein TVAG_165640 [Trichomonas vaginalis G3]KAI5506603.1 hypothetical protein TVAGG3_0662590 [Trichomonas vaginalis G3]|eukprot:XP_001328159.1 hypothetical protein [Trichomonas vaginalis G3]
MFHYIENHEEQLEINNEGLIEYMQANTHGEEFAFILFLGVSSSHKSRIATDFSRVQHQSFPLYNGHTDGAYVSYIGRYNDLVNRFNIQQEVNDPHLFLVDVQGFTANTIKTETLLALLMPLISQCSSIVFFQQSFTDLSFLPMIEYIYHRAERSSLIINITGFEERIANLDVRRIINDTQNSQISNELHERNMAFSIVNYCDQTSNLLYRKIMDGARIHFRRDQNEFFDMLNNPLLIDPQEIFRISNPIEYGIYEGLLHTMTRELYNLFIRYRDLSTIETIDRLEAEYNRTYEDYCQQFQPSLRVRNIINVKITNILQIKRQRVLLLQQQAADNERNAQERRQNQLAIEQRLQQIAHEITEIANNSRLQLLESIGTEDITLINNVVTELRLELNNYINRINNLGENYMNLVRNHKDHIINKFSTIRDVFSALLREKNRKKWIERFIIIAIIAASIALAWWYFGWANPLPAIKNLLIKSKDYTKLIYNKIPDDIPEKAISLVNDSKKMEALKNIQIVASILGGIAVTAYSFCPSKICAIFSWFKGMWDKAMEIIGLRVNLDQINELLHPFEEYNYLDN